MVEIIGVVTVVALSVVLAFGMANECDAEKRRRALSGRQLQAGNEPTPGTATKHAA